MKTYRAVAASVSERKRARPELYCAECLWMTGGGNCPRHGGGPWTRARQIAAEKRSREPKTVAVETVDELAGWTQCLCCNREVRESDLDSNYMCRVCAAREENA